MWLKKNLYHNYNIVPIVKDEILNQFSFAEGSGSKKN